MTVLARVACIEIYVCAETFYIEFRQEDIWSSSNSDLVLNAKIEIEAFVANPSHRTRLKCPMGVLPKLHQGQSLDTYSL